MRVASKFVATVTLLISSLSSAQANDLSPLHAARGNEEICNLDLEDQILPKLNTENKFEVGIGIQPLSIRNISTKDNSAEVDFYFTIEYEIDEIFPDVKCVGGKAENVWDIFYNPDIEFMSIANPDYTQGFHWMIEKNRFAYMTRVRGSLELNGNFRQFPFDHLLLKITASPEDSSETVILKPSTWYNGDLDDLMSDFDNIRVPGWELDRAYFEHEESRLADAGTPYWDELTLNLEISRNPLTIFARTSIPLLILFVITFCSTLLSEKQAHEQERDRFVDTRVQIQVGTLFALFAFSLYIMQVIPETSYLTLGDLNWFTFMLSTFLILSSEFSPSHLRIFGKNINVKSVFLTSSVILVGSLMVIQMTLLFIT